MPALVRDHGFEREVGRIRIPLESLGKDGQPVALRIDCSPVLRTACATLEVQIFDETDKTHAASDSEDPPLACGQLQ